MSQKITRRQFFRLGLLDHLHLIRTADNPEYSRSKSPPLRPPGALKKEEEFFAACDHCQKCSDACPHDAIFHLGPSAGPEEGTPVIDPSEMPCRWCPTMDCISACPSGALSFNDDGTVDPIGKAVLDLDLCLTQQGILCDDCATVCPTDIRAIKMVNRMPQIDHEKCIGCGLCVHYCAASPTAIRIIPDNSTT